MDATWSLQAADGWHQQFCGCGVGSPADSVGVSLSRCVACRQAACRVSVTALHSSPPPASTGSPQGGLLVQTACRGTSQQLAASRMLQLGGCLCSSWTSASQSRFASAAEGTPLALLPVLRSPLQQPTATLLPSCLVLVCDCSLQPPAQHLQQQGWTGSLRPHQHGPAGRSSSSGGWQ